MSDDPVLGVIGLGTMGGRMARNLLQAGYELVVFDLDEDRQAAVLAAGAATTTGADDVVKQSDIVLTSLPTPEVFVEVAETSLLPNVRGGQVFIDLGTVLPQEVRRLATDFENEGAILLDVPVSGGASGAETGSLRMFAGGAESTFRQVQPVLSVLGDPEYIVYCGPSGSGQLVKFVNQMAMGLTAAACLESLALGVGAGVAPEVLATAVGGDNGWRAQFGKVGRTVARGDGIEVGVKFGQLHYFVNEAQRIGLTLPLSSSLQDFCEPGERLVIEANRWSPSFWHELMKGGSTEE